MKKFLCLVLSVILLFLVPFHVHAANEEKAIRKQIFTFVSSCKKYNPSSIDKCFIKPQKGKYVGNKDIQKLIRKMHKNTKYDIKCIQINNTKALIKIDVEYYNADDITYWTLQNVVNGYLKTGKLNTSKIYKLLKKYYKNDVYEIYDDTNPNVPQEQRPIIGYERPSYEATIKFMMKKVNGKWKITNMPNKLYEFTDCGIGSTVDYYTKHPLKLIF